MKLKEYLPSFFKTLKLNRRSAEELKKASGNYLPLTVTLTSIPSRLTKVAVTVRSMMAQTRKPQKIVLWLHDELKGKLPKDLTLLQGGIFEIRYSPYTFSHRKLIHSLSSFPDEILVTCDDDMIYHPDTLALLYESHLKYPEAIIANRNRIISFNDSGDLKPYKMWSHISNGSGYNKNAVMPVGACCVLYPPDSLDKRVTNVDLFTKLTPKADDIWFKTMSYLKGTQSRPAEIKAKDPLPIFGSQKVSLKKVNISEDFNRVQAENVMSHFNINFK